MESEEPFQLRCERCQRMSSYTTGAVARYGRRCRYCGEGIPHAESEPGCEPSSARSVTASCPVCARSRSVAEPGQPQRCPSCGCHYQTPPADGCGSLIFDHVDRTVTGLATLSCPSCHGRLRLPGAWWVGTITCPLCQTERDLAAADWRQVFARARATDAVGRLIDAALAARWRAGEVRLGEAAETADWLSRLDAPTAGTTATNWQAVSDKADASCSTSASGASRSASASGASEAAPVSSDWVSPLPPEITAEIVRDLILREPSAMLSTPPGGGARLRIFLGAISPWRDKMRKAGILVQTLQHEGLLWMFAEVLAPGQAAQHAMVLDFSSAAGRAGTVMLGSLQDDGGRLSPLPPRQVAELQETIRARFAAEAASFLAFRTLFGPLVRPQMLTLAATDRLMSHIVALCPALTDEAETLARCLRPSR